MHRFVHSLFEAEPTSGYLDRFGWLLTLTYLTIAGQMLVNFDAQATAFGNEIGMAIAQTIATAMMLLAVQACGVRRRWRVAISLLALLGLAARLILVAAEIFSEQRLLVRSVEAPWGTAVLMLLTFGFVCYRLSRHRQVTSATLLAAITAYLLIPLVFYYVFLILDGVQPQHFFGKPQPGPEFMYFSLTTVTTLGYGDPSPVTDLGQLLATSEALIGQLYLVVVVALIVGLMTTRWHRTDEGNLAQ